MAREATFHPPPPPASLPPPSPAARVVPPAPGRRPRTRWMIGVVVGVAVLGLLVVGLDQVLTHDLLSEDFSEDDGRFFAGEIEDYRSEVRDGRYRLTATTSSPELPLESFGFFARTAHNVDIHADIAALDAPGATVGLECAHSAGDGRAGARYLFTASTVGDGYTLELVTGTLADARVLETAPGPALEAGQRIGLRCNDGAVTGLVDDTPVIIVNEPIFGSSEAVALVFGPHEEGDWIEFDEVTAVVPEH